MVAYNEIDIVRAWLFVACGCILGLFGCCIGFSYSCVCFEQCPSLLKCFKKFTLDFAQFLYGPTSITLNDDESLLVISEKKFQNNRKNIFFIFTLNLVIASLTLLAALKIFITEKSTEQCDENLPCFFYENGSKVDNCSNVDTKLCFYIDISPLQTIGFIGGFLKFATPLGFKFSTFVYLSLPYYFNAKCRCRCGPCGVLAIKIVLVLIYFILYVGAVATFAFNAFDVLDQMLKGFIETIIFDNKLGKIESFNVVDVIAIMTVIFIHPWYVLEKEGETKPQCPCTRRRGYEECAEQVPINKLSITKIV